MKRFEFSLQRLLETKAALEEGAQRRLADGLRCLQVGREELQRLETLLQTASGKMEAIGGRATCRHELLVHVQYRNVLQHHIRKQLKLVQKYEAAVQELRDQLKLIMMERQTLENLRTIEHKEWLVDQRRLEQKDMDEISAQRFFRRTAGVAI